MKPEFLKEVILQFSRCIDDTNADEYITKLIWTLMEGKNPTINLMVLKMLLK